MIITIPFKTPTVNHLHGHNKFGNTYLKPEAKKLKEHIADLVNVLPKEVLGHRKLKVIVEIQEDWLTKEGKVKRKDVANREKFLIDSIFEVLMLDDKYIYELIIRKIQSEKEQAIIKIEEYTL